MKIASFAARRPVTIWMAIAVVLMLGAVSLSKLSVDLLPKLNPPVLAVITLFPGASPQEVSKMVTEPLEATVSTCTNIKQLSSVSQENVSIIVGEFTWGTSMQEVRMDLADKLARLTLPDGVGSPQMVRFDPAMLPVMQLSASSSLDPAEVKRILEIKVKPRLESLDGVAAVEITGAPTREISVELDQAKLQQYSLSQAQVVQAIQANNINLPADVIKQDRRQLNVRVLGRLSSVDELKKLTVTLAPVGEQTALTAMATQTSALGSGSGLGIKLNLPAGASTFLRPVALGEVAEVRDGYAAATGISRTNGLPSIGLTIRKEGDANLVNVARLLESELDRIQAETPEIHFTVTSNQATFINMAVDNVQSNLIVGGLLAVAILWAFLRSYKSTLIIALSIPISIIATFVLLYFSKLNLNLMTLGGLALGVGMLVDNSIVVIENVYQHLERGENPLRAAMDGTNEVTGAIIATTLTTVVVFLPIVFVGGLTGDIFRELALTVSFSLMSSLIVSITVVPMLSAQLLSLPKGQRNMMGSVKRLTIYGRCLSWALQRPMATMGLTLVALVLAVAAAPLIGTEFLPATDEGSISISGQLAEGAMLSASDQICQQIEAKLGEIDEIDVFTSTVGAGGQSYMSASTAGSNEFSIGVRLRPRSERQRSTTEVVQALSAEILCLDLDAKVTVSEQSLIQSLGASNHLELTISAPTTEDVARINQQVQERLAAIPGVTRISDNLSTAKPVIDVIVDRAKSMSFALSPAQVGLMVRGALSGQVATQYDDQGLAVDVRVRYREEDRGTVDDLSAMLVRSPMGPELPLQDLAFIREGVGPVTLTRQDGQNSCTVAVLREDGDLGSSISLSQELLAGITLPPGASIKFDGAVELMQSGFADLRLTMFLAIALVYMVMAAQFESFKQPMIIMLTLPLAAIGMVLALVITGRHLGVTAFIGVVMLVGIVVDNAIVLLDCVNQYRSKGMEIRNALITGAQERLRPILMTTVTTILGLIPLALGIGEGAELQAPLATVVIGGLVSSTFLTLVIIPVIYLMVESGPQPTAHSSQKNE